MENVWKLKTKWLLIIFLAKSCTWKVSGRAITLIVPPYIPPIIRTGVRSKFLYVVEYTCFFFETKGYFPKKKRETETCIIHISVIYLLFCRWRSDYSYGILLIEIDNKIRLPDQTLNLYFYIKFEISSFLL